MRRRQPAPATAAAAAEAIRQNPGVVVLEESGSKVGGLDGLNVTIENNGAAHTAHEGIRRDARHRMSTRSCALDVDAPAGEAWLAIRRPGRVGTVIAVDLATEAVTSETAVALPAGVRIAPDRVWVTDYEGNDLVGIART